jgi:predicted flap endonuclease-1-like 5' DNA nuclease
VHAISAALGFTGRIERENWIEQAQILARGGATTCATGLASDASRAMAPASAPTAPSLPERGPDVAGRAAFAEPRRTEPTAPAAPAPATPGGRDNLQRIGGISSEIEIGLNAHAITRYSQIAGWSADDVQQFEALLGSSGRISRENWIEQARILARGGATSYSRIFDERGGPPPPAVVPPAPPAPVAEAPVSATPEPVPVAPAPAPPVAESSPAERAPDLSGMRSVRSEAFRASDSMAPSAPAKPDDLKRIRGVGLLIERKLNAMGIATYEQIANWTADDVGTVNAKLEFKGRIERENWIEQARILASGGQTDFSRRFERGEV